MKVDTTTALNWGPYVCAFEIMCTLSCTDYTVYGAVCAVSTMVMSEVGGVVCAYVYIRCKHKGNMYIFALQPSIWCEFFIM